MSNNQKFLALLKMQAFAYLLGIMTGIGFVVQYLDVFSRQYMTVYSLLVCGYCVLGVTLFWKNGEEV